MALFKIEKGLAENLSKNRPNTVEGYCYVTTDDGKFYIDTVTANGTDNRIVLNAGSADKLAVGTVGSENQPVYFKDGVPVNCGTLKLSAAGDSNTPVYINEEGIAVACEGIEGYLPLTAGENNKLTGPLGLTSGIGYGSTLPETGFEGQLFFLEDSSLGVPTGGSNGQILSKASGADGDFAWVDNTAEQKVSKSGDTMTGDLIINKSSPYAYFRNTDTGRSTHIGATSDNYTVLYNTLTSDPTNTRVGLWIGPETATDDNLLRLQKKTNGTSTVYKILHEGTAEAKKLDYTNMAYGTCTTAADVAEKVITISGNANWELKVGSLVSFVATYTNTASNPTLNVNGTGAKPISYNGSAITTSYLPYAAYANISQLFIYNGEYYVWIGHSADWNSDTKVTQTLVAPTTETTYPILGSTSTSTNTNTTIKNNSAKLDFITGTTSTVGKGQINLGNATASGTAGNAKGVMVFYSENTGYVSLSATNTTGSYANYLPAKSGTLVNNNIAAATSKAYIMGVSATGSSSASVTANSSVYTSGSVLYGAAWNDYAEYRELREDIEIPYGRVVIENGDDTLSLSAKRLQGGGNVCSDTFGFAIGETDKAKMPIAVSGRVLVYPYEDRNIYEPGDAVCTGPEGTVSKMTREEIKEYPDRIIGYVSAVPTYDIWGENDVAVNGRIWIKVV